MKSVSYVFYRSDTGSFYFRWVVPVKVRTLLGGRREVKKSLHTNERRLALKLARRLSVMLEGIMSQLLAQRASSTQDAAPASYLTVALLERHLDGTIRMEGLDMDPAGGEEERKHLASLLGIQGAAASHLPSADGRKLSDLVKAYFEEGDRAQRWTLKTRQELESIYVLVQEIVGADKSLADLTRKDFARLKDMLTKLPSNRSKDARYRDKSVLELAGMKIPASDLMSVNTINKSLIRTSSLIKFGVLNGLIETNYAEGMTIAKGKRDDEERDPYTVAEVLMLKSALLAGFHGSDRSPYMKWVPLIGMYSGMRLNEICQLALEDFSEVDGIPVMHVTDEGDKRVKTANSRRTVPIHPELVSLGLLDYVAAMRMAKATRLFPELSRGRDGYGSTVSKWFKRQRDKLGLAKDFHSLRHTVSTKLREAGVPEDVTADLLGHERSNRETYGRYASAASVQRVYDALLKLRYEEKQPTHLRLAA